MFSKEDINEIMRKSSFLNEERNNIDNPLWIQFLNKVVEGSKQHAKKGCKNYKLFDQTNPIPFEEILSPFVTVATEELLKKSTEILYYFSEKAILHMQKSLLKRLSKISSETFYIEFCANNIYYIKKFLGESSELEKESISNIEYTNFINSMLNGGLESFFIEYSVLARHLSQTACFWIDFISELSFIIKKDYSQISNTFFSKNIPGKILSIDLNLSDYHNNNKTVVKLTFENEKSIIFKPRNIGIEMAYYNFLNFLNLKNSKLSYKILKIIDGKTYGWIEFVEHLPCETIEQVQKYYRRSGGLLCIVYALQGADFHLENIISEGENPVLIDLEMLMHNSVNLSHLNSFLNMEDLLQNRYSVLYTGLLPVPCEDEDGKISDLSGLGGEINIKTTLKESIWQNINTDSMSVYINYIKRPSFKNVVKLNNNCVNAEDYVTEIMEGFQEMYKIFLKLKDELLQENSIINMFSHQLLRYVFRETKSYYQLIKSSLNSVSMRNGLDWSNKIQSGLASRQFGVESMSNILAYENKSLNKLDIPYFNYWSDSKDLNISSNGIINNFFSKTAFNSLKENLKNLNTDDMQIQIGSIKNSYKMIVGIKNFASSPKQTSQIVSSIENSIEEDFFVQQAEKIIDKIIDSRIESPENLNWLHLVPASVKTYNIEIIESRLYDGKAGIAILLAAMSKISKKKNYKDLVHKIFNPYKSSYYKNQLSCLEKRMNLGIASGLGAIIYSYALSGKFLNENKFNEEALKIIPKLSSELIDNDTILDIIGGSAGLILSLLALYKETKSEETLLLAICCGKHLLKNRFKSKNGLRAWKHSEILTIEEQPLCGFAHGASGIAYALIKLFKVTAIKEFLDAAEEAILYEDSFLSNDIDQWPDLRECSAASGIMKLTNAWCHGASGILITRMEALSCLNKEKMNDDIDRALKIIINTSSNTDHLCCGAYGRIDVLLTASRKLSRPDLQKKALELATSVYNKNKLIGRNLILKTKYPNPEFFEGMSGIAYTMLRLSSKEEMPSVLSLDI
ncbi:MAG: type 2 lanthipeptide synthetase LanM family protein [Bacillota bacterium]|nr:type 2 lanthipeptide synthetase LanM family protein [Bacillota bacterium]